MRPIDRFFSRLSRLEAGPVPDKKQLARVSGDFAALVAPLTGARTAGELFDRALGRIERFGGPGKPGGGSSLQKLGAIAAFFTGEFDDETMSLEDEDWEDLRETLKEISGEMDIETLTALMGELLSRGKI
ncbi:MAG: hypothetical protein LBJ90_08010 [Treponema sp.]|jgi:hypothetical protein|nr:hypothetical protein [Treponema sp.]